MLKRIDHVEIVPQDFERSLAFYTGTLGFALDHRYSLPAEAAPIKEVAYLILNGSAIELLRAEPAAVQPRQTGQVGYNAMAWEVDDMEATLRDFATKGIAPTWGPRTRPTYIRAEIADPDGNAIELRQWLKAPAALR
ncbi:MAG TPA: VOC family protein [Alphaproteobacteria bacterium]|nr:VOC family protein [Alphaproteobacteria bacterium]